MVVHIVLFAFKEENKEQNIQRVKEQLMALPQKIEVLKSMEVGINETDSPRAMDLSLYSTFESFDDLKTYATHPAHLEVLEYIKAVTEFTKVVDYTL